MSEERFRDRERQGRSAEPSLHLSSLLGRFANGMMENFR